MSLPPSTRRARSSPFVSLCLGFLLTVTIGLIAVIRALQDQVATTEVQLEAIRHKLPVSITVNVQSAKEIAPTLHALLPAMAGVPTVDITGKDRGPYATPHAQR